jgi:hypothetical protein
MQGKLNNPLGLTVDGGATCGWRRWDSENPVGGETMSRHWEIVRLTEEQAEAAGALIHRALVEEPIGRYMYPDPQERQRLLPLFTLWSRQGCLSGHIYTTAGEPYAVALWNPPDTGDPTPERNEQAGLPRARDIMGPDALQRWGSVMDYMTRVNYEKAPPPHWYLSILGSMSGHAQVR